MKAKKNVCQRILFLLLFFVFIISLNVGIVSAAETKISNDDITVDYQKQEMTVKLGENNTIFYGIGNETKEPSIWDEINNSQISTVRKDDQDVKVAIIDFSFTSPSKDTYLYLKGDVTSDVTQVQLKKQKKLKVSYVGSLNAKTDSNGTFQMAYAKESEGKKIYSGFSDEAGYFTFLSDGTAYTELSNIEWRKGLNGTWSPLSKLQLTKYKANGAVLYFRINTNAEQISNEARVTYPKMAAAPSVAIDGMKHTIKLSTKVEYRVKVATSSYGAWTTPTFADGKQNGSLDIASLTGADQSNNGDGVSSPLKDMVIQVRTKATDKKTVSKVQTVKLYQSVAPKFGSNGIEVDLVNKDDIKKGIKITNHTSMEYQIAIIDKTDQGAYKAIQDVKLTAKNKEAGYIAFTNVKGGKTATISYAKFKDFADHYIVVCRTATIKEDTKTAKVEFRLASSIILVGGDTPVSDTNSGAIVLAEGQTSISKTVTFKVENPESEVYISKNGADYHLSSDGKETFTAAKDDKVVLKAYSKNKVNGELSETVTITLNFMASGELSDYKNEWGYVLCKKEDTQKSSSSRQIAYQRIYLAYATYEANVSVFDLQLSFLEVTIIAQRVRVDNPELLQATLGLSYSMSGSYVKEIVLDITSKEKAEALRVECEKCLEEVKAKITSTYGASATKLQKMKVIHDYLILKKEYKSSAMDQTIAGALCKDYTPVCMAYAMAFKYLCDDNGIQTYVVLGYTGGKTSNRHAWNNVNLGTTVDYATASTIDSDQWYEIDVTWDDPLGAAEDYIGYTYFNITTVAMTNASHTRLYEYYKPYPVENCTGTTDTYSAIRADNHYSNGDDTKETLETDSISELIKRNGVKEPTYTKE